jgi:hypothetical protein
MMELSFILLCVVFSKQHFAHIFDMFDFDSMLYVLFTVWMQLLWYPQWYSSQWIAAWLSRTSLPQTEQGYSRLICGSCFGWQSEEFNIRKVWRYQRGNQNAYIEEQQTTQWPKEKVQKDKQRSTKHTYKTKDLVTRTQLKIGGEFRCSGRVSSSSSTSGTRRVNLVTNPVITREWGKDREVLTTSGTYPW